MSTRKRAPEQSARDIGVYNGVTDEQVAEFMEQTGETDPVQARLHLTRILQRRSNREINKRARSQIVHIHNEGRRK